MSLKLPFGDIMSFTNYVQPALIINLLLIVVLATIYRFVWSHLYKRSINTVSYLDDTFLKAVYLPFYMLLALIAIKMNAIYIPDQYLQEHPQLEPFIGKVFSAGIAAFIVIVINKFLSNIQAKIVQIGKNQVVDNGAAWVSACKLGRMLSVLVFILVAFSLFDIPMAQIAAPSAVGALALSFASKDVLSNMFGGLVVMCDRPFKVGDYVVIGGQDEGTVRYIGWRMTQVNLRNGRILHVPNGVITTSAVTNYSEKTHWFVQKEIGLRYQDMHVASEVARELEGWIQKHSLTNRRQTSFAHVFDFADSSVNIRVRVFLKSTITTKQWYGFIEEMLMFTKDIVSEKGADFAFPTTQVVMDKAEK